MTRCINDRHPLRVRSGRRIENTAISRVIAPGDRSLSAPVAPRVNFHGCHVAAAKVVAGRREESGEGGRGPFRAQFVRDRFSPPDRNSETFSQRASPSRHHESPSPSPPFVLSGRSYARHSLTEDEIRWLRGEEEIIEGGNVYIYISGNTRGGRCAARMRKTGGQRNGDIRETRRHFIDSPGDDALHNARLAASVLGRRVSTDGDRVSWDRTSGREGGEQHRRARSPRMMMRRR